MSRRRTTISVNTGGLWRVHDSFVIVFPRSWPFRLLAWLVRPLSPSLAKRIRNRYCEGIVTSVRGNCLNVSWGEPQVGGIGLSEGLERKE